MIGFISLLAGIAIYTIVGRALYIAIEKRTGDDEKALAIGLFWPVSTPIVALASVFIWIGDQIGSRLAGTSCR